MNGEFIFPDELAMQDFFGSEPIERSVEDGYWCYEATDPRGVVLRFSFNLFEQSVQTVLLLGGMPLATVSHEGAANMKIKDHVLTCLFSVPGADAKLRLELGSAIAVEWSSLRG